MKNYFSCIAGLLTLAGSMLVSVGAQAQAALPNASFESWEGRTIQTLGGPITFQAPQGWNPGFISGLLSGFGIVPRFSRSTVAHSGSASLRITPALQPDSLGGDVIVTVPTNGGTAFGVNCWVRYANPQPRELGKASVLAFVTRTQGGVTDTIGVGGFQLPAGPANTWTQLSGPIGYMNPAVTRGDSVTMLIGYFQGVPGDAILFDDAALLSTAPSAAPADRAVAAPLTLGPNPAPAQADAVTLTVPSTTAAPAVLVLTDALGRTVGHLRNVRLAVGDNQLRIPTAHLSAGTYTVRLISPAGTRSVTLVRE